MHPAGPIVTLVFSYLAIQLGMESSFKPVGRRVSSTRVLLAVVGGNAIQIPLLFLFPADSPLLGRLFSVALFALWAFGLKWIFDTDFADVIVPALFSSMAGQWVAVFSLHAS